MLDNFVAFIGKPDNNGLGCDRVVGQTYAVTDWHGHRFCSATKGSTWPVNSRIGSHMSQWYTRHNGREYTGRGFGEGMSIVFRETAASKRQRKERSQ